MTVRQGASILMGFFVLAASPSACTPPSPLEILEFEVSPTGSVAMCEAVSVRFSTNMKTRYVLTSGYHVVSAGLTQGLHEEIRFFGDELSTDATTLRLTLASINGAEVNESVELSLEVDNTAPIARPRLIGEPQLGEMVQLEGSLSEDLDGDPIASHEWSIAAGPPDARLDQTGEAMAILHLPSEPALVVVDLTVTDIGGSSDTSTLLVRVTDIEGGSPPQLESPEVFETRQVQPGETVELSARATDPDDDQVQIDWRQIAGPLVDLVIDGDGTVARFTAPDSWALLGFDVSASDGPNEVKARVEVSVGDIAPDEIPRPVATLIDRARPFVPVRISAESTTDPDTEELWYEWNLIRAPTRSLLGNDSIQGRSGFDATVIEAVFDRPGSYEFELRVEDALGPSPEVSRITVDISLVAQQIHSNPVTDVICRDGIVAWTGPEGAALRSNDRIVPMGGATEVGAIAFSGSGDGLWIDATSHNFGRPAVALASIATGTFSEFMDLPDGPNQINAIAIDPATSRLGDVYVGTEVGSAILDISDNSCVESVGLGCWVGTISIGYLYQPPSRLSFPSTEVDLFHVGLDDDGTTVVHLGNRYWLVQLERGDGEELVSQRAIDIFSDSQPQRVTALASTSDALYCGTEPLGLVRIGEDRECGYGELVDQKCRRTMLDSCTLSATLGAPSWVGNLAAWGSSLFIASSDGLYHYDSSLSRFSQVEFSEGLVVGTPEAVAVCSDTLFFGTTEGLWEIGLEGEG